MSDSFRTCLLLAMWAAWIAARPALAKEQAVKYRSPYSVRFTVPVEQLLDDISRGERGDVRQESRLPYDEWYSASTRTRWKSWGPPARNYAPLSAETFDKHTIEWKRERVIAVALRYSGYQYQHHHIPDWNPPADWPWKETVAGSNGKGLDCSNFSSFVFNQGFGIRFPSEIQEQAELKQVEIPGLKRQLPLQRIELAASYAERIQQLRTGDLLFIRSRNGDRISHVVLWIGAIGKSPDNTPLVIDSHGETVRDYLKQPIPTGVQLRPYRESGWYHKNASYALRVFPDIAK